MNTLTIKTKENKMDNKTRMLTIKRGGLDNRKQFERIVMNIMDYDFSNYSQVIMWIKSRWPANDWDTVLFLAQSKILSQVSTDSGWYTSREVA